MSATNYVTTKDLVIEGKTITKGTTVGVLQADIPADRLIAGLTNGAIKGIPAEPEKPEAVPVAPPVEEPAATAPEQQPQAAPVEKPAPQSVKRPK